MNLVELFPTREQIPADHRMSRLDQRDYLSNGKLRDWSGPTAPVYSPVCVREGSEAVQEEIGSIPLCQPEDAEEALSAAVQAWNQGRGEWACMPVGDRIKAVSLFASQMKRQREQVVRLLMWEIGKNYSDSCKEFDRTLAYIDDTIESLKELDRVSSRFQIVEGIIAQVRRAPLGVTVCMGPFNYPLNETFTTLIPALIMGNPVVFKPARYGVLLLRPLLEAFRDCFPAGVVNTVYGDGKTVITPMMSSGKVDVLAFIGSSPTANAIIQKHPAPNRLRNILALNAKNPAIILSDADIALTVKECLLGSLSFNGQRCTALKLLFVQEEIADKFVREFSDAVNSLKLGMPWEEGVNITPLPEPGKTEWLKSLIEDAVEKGASVVNTSGGESYRTLLRPAVVYPVTPAMRLYEEEQFGPVVPIVRFRDPEEVVRYIAGSRYGQQASIFSSSPERIAELVDPLSNQLCRININSQCQRGPDVFPFTGRKDSAEGTLSVSDALRVFSIRTLVAAKMGELNNELVRRIVHEHKSAFLNTDFII